MKSNLTKKQSEELDIDLSALLMSKSMIHDLHMDDMLDWLSSWIRSKLQMGQSTVADVRGIPLYIAISNKYPQNLYEDDRDHGHTILKSFIELKHAQNFDSTRNVSFRKDSVDSILQLHIRDVHIEALYEDLQRRRGNLPQISKTNKQLKE